MYMLYWNIHPGQEALEIVGDKKARVAESTITNEKWICKQNHMYNCLYCVVEHSVGDCVYINL